MADYINKNILCQAYIHIEPDDLAESDYEIYDRNLIEFTQERGKFFLYSDIDVELDSAEGSVKKYVTIMGTLGALYAGVAQYDDFRQGVITMYDDVKRMSEYIISEGLFTSKAKHDQIIRLEARTGVIGSLRKVIADIDLIIAKNGTVSAKQMSEMLERLHTDVSKLIDNLKNDNDINLVKTELSKLANTLPRKPKPRPKRKENPDFISWYSEHRRKLIDSLKET